MRHHIRIPRLPFILAGHAIELTLHLAELAAYHTRRRV